MSLPKDKRQTEEQAKPFAKKAMERIPSSGDPYGQIMRWLQNSQGQIAGVILGKTPLNGRYAFRTNDVLWQ